MSEAGLEIVFDHFHARSHRDIKAVEATLDPVVVHQGVDPELVCNGRDEVLDLVQRSFARRPSGIESIEFIDAGERVVVALSGRQFRDVPVLEGQLFMVFTLKDGAIIRIDDYRTRDEAFTAAQTGTLR